MRQQQRPRGEFSPTLGTLLGSTFIHRLTDRKDAPLVIGSSVFTRHDLAMKLGVVNTHAARRLTTAARSINAKNVRDLYRRSSPYTFAGVGGLGETTMYVLWRVFESAGLDPDAWATAGKTDEALVAFRSLKKRELAAERRTKARPDERRQTDEEEGAKKAG